MILELIIFSGITTLGLCLAILSLFKVENHRRNNRLSNPTAVCLRVASLLLPTLFLLITLYFSILLAIAALIPPALLAIFLRNHYEDRQKTS